MDKDEIIKGIKYRLGMLADAMECYNKPDSNVSKWIREDTEARIEEMRTLLDWIEEK